MAEACNMVEGVLEDQDPFSCPICLDPLEEPVTIPCGHSYCRECIKDCWDQEDQRGVYSCPQCRQTFEPRPVLNKNTMFAEVVERLKRTSLQAAPVGHCFARPGDVECDVCSGRKQKAVKTCLVCVASYCETHFKLHASLNPGQRHKVIDSTEHQVKFCCRHGKRLEAFCRTDQSFICHLCPTDGHRGHEIVLAETALAQAKGHRKDGHSTSNHRSHGHKSGHRHTCIHRHGRTGEHTGGHGKTGHRSSGHTRRRHRSGHGKREHKSDAHGTWHRRSHHEKGGKTGH